MSRANNNTPTSIRYICISTRPLTLSFYFFCSLISIIYTYIYSLAPGSFCRVETKLGLFISPLLYYSYNPHSSFSLSLSCVLVIFSLLLSGRVSCSLSSSRGFAPYWAAAQAKRTSPCDCPDQPAPKRCVSVYTCLSLSLSFSSLVLIYSLYPATATIHPTHTHPACVCVCISRRRHGAWHASVRGASAAAWAPTHRRHTWYCYKFVKRCRLFCFVFSSSVRLLILARLMAVVLRGSRFFLSRYLQQPPTLLF